MHTTTWRWRALGAMGLGLALTGIGLTASVAPVSGDGPVAQEEDAGVLLLRTTTSGGTLSFVPPGATMPTVTQQLTVTSKSAAATAGALASITAVNGSQNLGLVTGGLGVRQKNTCSTAEGRVSNSEAITIALGTHFDDNVFVTAAELDIEGKFDSDLSVALDGGTALSRALVSSSDNGPDSGLGDNDRVLISRAQTGVVRFRSMRLSAAGGEIALEGGADAPFAQYVSTGKVGPLGASAGTAATILELTRFRDFEDDLSCGEDRPAAVRGDAADVALVTRHDNLDGGSCEDVGVTFEINDDGVLLDKGTTGLGESGSPQAVHALVDISWTAQVAEVPLPGREINFTPDDPTTWEPVQWCTSWDASASPPVAVHPADPRFPGGVLPWCLVDEHIELQDDGTVIQIQRYDGAGDPMWR